MSNLIAAPEMMTMAATDLAGIGSSLSEANAAAAASTTRVITAAGDEVRDYCHARPAGSWWTNWPRLRPSPKG